MQRLKKHRSFLAIIVGCIFLLSITSYTFGNTSFSEDTSVASSDAEDLWVNILNIS